MHIQHNTIVYSPSDIILYMESPFASWMEHYALITPEILSLRDDVNSMKSMLQEKGEEHELAVLQTFEEQGLSLADIRQAEDKLMATQSALNAGVDIIFQACLQDDSFSGFADFLVKVPGQSKLGDYHYEIWDTKLSKTMKPYFTIQLCAYQNLLQKIQGRRSDEFVIVLGNGQQERLKTNDYFYYYQSVCDDFLQMHQDFNTQVRPDPADSQTWGVWQNYAKSLLAEEDHLSQVATITRSQIKKLKQANICSMTALAEATETQIAGLSQALLHRLKAQARIQKASQGLDIPCYEILLPEEGQKQGLALLPPHSDLDIFFDIEGFPLMEGGLEYLWGCSFFNEKGEREFVDFWAHNHQEEKQAFSDFIHWVYQRWQADPKMHIYHYANYEIAACRKLMSRYGVCEQEVDQLLRNEVFVDLYTIIKKGLLIGEPKYSIKNVEHLYRSQRDTAVGTGGDSVVVYENWRQNPDGETWQTSQVLRDIRDYNIDDCNSTQELTAWLRLRQAEHNIIYTGAKDPVEPEVPEEITARTLLRNRLLRRQEPLAENMAWSLEFHRRESKPVFWKLFDRLGLTATELYDDLDCLAMCQRTSTPAYKPTARARNLVYEYRFNPDQEFKAAGMSSYYVLGEEVDGQNLKVSYFPDNSDIAQGIICVQAKAEPPAMMTLVPDEYVRPDPMPQSIQAVVEAYEAGQLNRCAIVDFLQREFPRIKGITPGQSIAPSHNSQERLQQIINAVQNLDHSYLPIQGPPGAGKTFTGKHVIAALLQQGKKIGISSNSHKAINNLLIGAAEYCQQQHIHAFFACTKETDSQIQELGIAVLQNKNIINHTDSACVIGTTAWGFSREELQNQFDYLFIDEAGQVSVANLIAMSASTENIILMGDQMQLGQPAQGTHPGESGLSTLDYLLHESPTVTEDRGIFLETTYRMHSAVNHFISHAIYEGKLQSHPDNDRQVISVPDHNAGPIDKPAGLFFIPVNHEGNTQASDEEVAEILKLTQELLGRDFTDKKGQKRAITLDDMLFVAPYNFQVNKLRQALGVNAKVGSVDKFQGQEAPIVFLSMCASNADESPRGLDFLFDKNRLNVAISRAQSIAIVVGNPALAKSNAQNIQQQSKINLFCQIVQGYTQSV